MSNTNSSSILIVINNGDGRILSSETFLLSHINLLPKPVIPIVGIPGHRILINEEGKTIPSRSILLLGMRWLARRLGLSSIDKQDRRALEKFLCHRKIGVVLAEYGPTAVSVMDACRDASVPLVAHFHGFDAYTYDVITKYSKHYLKLFNQASAIVAVSNHMREQLLILGSKKEKTFVNPCGAEIPGGCSAEPERSQIRFIMVGRLVEKKAPFLSIMAFSKVIKKYPDASLDIIGDGPLKNVCQQIASALEIMDKIVFHGAQPHEKVFQLMKESRCFVQHSVCTPDNDHEGTPVGVLEAMGMGLPVIATRHGGIQDVIEEGLTGCLVDEYDVEEMAQKMLNFAGDASLAQKIGKNARLAIKQNLTADMSISRLSKIIQQAMKK